MADPDHPYPDATPDDDTGGGPGRGSTTGTQPWATIVGIVIVIALLLLMIVAHATGIVGPGLHGLLPGLHGGH